MFDIYFFSAIVSSWAFNDMTQIAEHPFLKQLWTNWRVARIQPAKPEAYRMFREFHPPFSEMSSPVSFVGTALLGGFFLLLVIFYTKELLSLAISASLIKFVIWLICPFTCVYILGQVMKQSRSVIFWVHIHTFINSYTSLVYPVLPQFSHAALNNISILICNTFYTDAHK